MADNVSITGGSGIAIAADDVSSVYYQKIKLDVGGDGSTVPVLSTVAAVPISTADSVITVTPTLDTNAYAANDLLFDSTEVASAVRANAWCATLESVTIIDKDDQGVAFTLVLADAATDFGTVNSAPDADDTEAATVLGTVPVALTDWLDIGGAQIACIRNIGLPVKAGAATTSLYVAGINGGGTPTFTASGLVIKLGFKDR